MSKPRLLICMEVDGILLQGFQYSWQEIWKYLGYDDELRRIGMQQYLNGEISYAEWCEFCQEHFVSAGLKREDFAEITKPFGVIKGLHEGIAQLKEQGAVVAIISGGVDTFLEAMIPDCQEIFDHIFINRFEFNANGRLAGIVPTHYDFEGKAECIENLQLRYGISAHQSTFIGGDLNDTYAAKVSGTSIAWNPNDQEVEQLFDITVYGDDFMDIVRLILPEENAQHS